MNNDKFKQSHLIYNSKKVLVKWFWFKLSEKTQSFDMTEPAPIRYDTLVQVFQIEECQSKYHLGREFSDVFETMFIIAWIQLIPTLITLLHYVSGIFSKGRHIICCCEKWKKSKVHADNMTEPDSEPNFRRTA